MKLETLADQLFYSTVRIEAIRENSHGIGTGFCFHYDIDGNKGVRFVVTNRHVIKNCSVINMIFPVGTPEGTPDPKKQFTIQSVENAWIKHPKYDLAILSVVQSFVEMQKQGHPISTRTFSQNNVPTQAQLDELDSIEDVMFVGYPIGIWDEINMLPIIRRGITATPVFHNWRNEPRFLIDAGVYPGSSGSPVFIYNRGYYSDRKGNTTIGSRFYLLGLLERGFVNTNYGKIEEVEIPTVYQVKYKDMINLGSVLKSQILVELIEEILKDKKIIYLDE